MGIFGAVQQLVETAGSAPPLDEQAGGDDQQHARYHRRIVFVAGCFAVVGLLFGITLSVVEVSAESAEHTTRQIILVPVVFGVAGFVFGTAVMCLFAPREFLTGPTGAAWMKLIGTESVSAARVACLLFTLVIVVPILAMGVFLALVA